MATRMLSFAALFALGASSVAAQQVAAPAMPLPAALSPMGVPAGATGGNGNSPQIFQQNCAGCHGNDLQGGRAHSLFQETFLAEHGDTQLRQTILDGISSADMPSFRGRLNDVQIGQLLAYLRIQSGTLRTLPTYVPNPNNQVIKSEKQTFKLEVVASGLDTPWGEAFLPDGRMLVTERSGHIRIISKQGKLLAEPVKGTPTPWVRQDGGFFDIAVHPDYAKNGWIYLSYSEVLPGYAGKLPPADGTTLAPGAAPIPLPPSMTRFVRGRINARNEWVDQQDIYKAPDSFYTPSIIHYGSRFLFDRTGHLFWTMGDRGDMTNAQRLDTPLGKIHRVNDDGTIPKDNPFINTPGAIGSIWAYGNRNPEGLSFDPVTGLLWESEHGPTGGDEINIIEKGHNYGWGVVSMGLQPGITSQHQAGMDDPVTYYSPSIGPSGIVFNTSRKYPGWKNSLLLSALVGAKLYRYDIKGRNITHQEILWQQFGRTRDVIVGPDGLLYVLIQNPTGRGTGLSSAAATPGAVIRIVPKK